MQNLQMRCKKLAGLDRSTLRHQVVRMDCKLETRLGASIVGRLGQSLGSDRTRKPPRSKLAGLMGSEQAC